MLFSYYLFEEVLLLSLNINHNFNYIKILPKDPKSNSWEFKKYLSIVRKTLVSIRSEQIIGLAEHIREEVEG